MAMHFQNPPLSVNGHYTVLFKYLDAQSYLVDTPYIDERCRARWCSFAVHELSESSGTAN